MKLLKQDKDYKYYLLSDREMDNASYYNSDVIAINKSDLKYLNAKDCLNDGLIKACEYESIKDHNYVIDIWVIDPSTIIIVD